MMNYDNHSNNNLLFLLPADITINILSRLPVESVLQCKHVCKTWQTLINDPVFVHTHSDRLLLHDNISFGFLLCTYNIYGTVDYRFGEYSIHHGSCPTTTGGAFRLKKPINHEPFPLVLDDDDDDDVGLNYKQQPQWLLKPVDSCNGLICLVSTLGDGYNMCVYNPLTREYVNLLPRFNNTIINNRYNTGTTPSGIVSTMIGRIATGFGYHPGTKEYKIVRIYYENMCCSGQVSVYTLGSGCGWRSKGETSHLLYGGISGSVFANGALHWLANSDKYIVSFDMVDEEFRIIPLPPPNVRGIQLGVLNGCLSATGINSDSPQNSSDVWVMSMTKNKKKHDDDDDQEGEYSWSKKYNIPWNKSRLTPYKPPLAPLGDDNNNKILLHYGYMEMVSYDTKRDCLDDNILHKTELVDTYKLIPYRKSITSLKALGENGARIGRTVIQQQLITTSYKKRKRRGWLSNNS